MLTIREKLTYLTYLNKIKGGVNLNIGPLRNWWLISVTDN